MTAIRKTAFSHWNGRIAPVFDTAAQLLVIEHEGGGETGRTDLRLCATDAEGRAAELARAGIETLVCGAISSQTQAPIAARGIRVLAFVAGALEEVSTAAIAGRLRAGGAMSMPGCCGRRRRGAGHYSGAAQADTCYCLCPECGQREPHRRGVPCSTRRCANCGAALRKE